MYSIGGQHYATDGPALAEALARAHISHERPRCLCRGDGIEMYIARFGGEHVIKRMPYSGSQHAPNCPSYEPPHGLSDAGAMTGSAVTEDTETGMTSLKLAFALSKLGARVMGPADSTKASSADAGAPGLSLRALLHYLWDRAELTLWKPAFAGKRPWAIVRARVLSVATKTLIRGEVLAGTLYVPEMFTVERREEIEHRRLKHWERGASTSSKRRWLMLLLGELKELAPTRYGFKAVVKHLPDQPFLLSERLYRQVERQFERELSIWTTSATIHLVVIATFGVSEAVPVIEEMSLMLASPQWLPVGDSDGTKRLESRRRRAEPHPLNRTVTGVRGTAVAPT